MHFQAVTSHFNNLNDFIKNDLSIIVSTITAITTCIFFQTDLQDVLRHGGKKESIMKNTIKRLPVTLAIPFLKEVCCLHYTSTWSCIIAIL